jgi:hypothetical protein
MSDLGQDIVANLSDGLSITAGVYGRFGLTNIYAGNQDVPYWLNRTQNAALLISVSLNYTLR